MAYRLDTKMALSHAAKLTTTTGSRGSSTNVVVVTGGGGGKEGGQPTILEEDVEVVSQPHTRGEMRRVFHSFF